ncbi:PREDICTED: uncharacterized protein LOC104510524, partial [Eurypyga helias]|uniref:uncharacterized protein LOC104510524 n=1 Tax=Eurypyga helias TaxID=54383 RepID=UPI0005288AA1
FHSVNLVDTVYQEEKLTFFNSLKKMRMINEKLMNEISNQPNDTEMVLNNDAEIIALEFGEIFKTLEMKKWQMLEDVESERIKKEKEFQIWKKMKETHKKTTENFLKDCDKLVHERDPQRFLEVACGLNARMKTQLDLMNIASSYEKPPEYIQKRMDIKPVVNEILALKLMPVNTGIAKDVPSGINENSTKNTLFKNNIKQWQDQKDVPSSFLPVAGQEEALADGSRICTRLMSISEMSAFQNMSHEELRYKYYVERQKLTSEFKTQTLPANKTCNFVTADAFKDRSSGTPFVSSPTRVNNADKVKMGTLQRADGFEGSFSGTSSHSIPSTNMYFSETNGDLKFFHERSSQEVTTPALSDHSTSDSLTSSMCWSGSATEKMEKEKVKSPEKTALNLGKPESTECAELASRHSHPKWEGSFLPMNSSKKTESAEMLADSDSSCSQPFCSVVLPLKYENAPSAPFITATKQEIKVKDEENETVAENNSSCPGREDEPVSVQLPNAACSVPGTCNDPSLGACSVLAVNEAGGMPRDSNSDTEEQSQTSASVDTSTASEYFSVAKDKIPTRRQSES